MLTEIQHSTSSSKEDLRRYSAARIWNNIQVLLLLHMRRPLTLNVFFLLLYQFKKNKVRDYTDSDSDYDEYDQEDRDLILRQVPDSLTVCLPQGFFSCSFEEWYETKCRFF